jgi:hypothetical protein
MKRALMIPLVVLVLASLACSLFTPKPSTPTEAPAVAVQPTATTAPQVEAVQATEPPPAAEPTDTEAPAEELPTETSAPTDTAAPTSITDKFDRANSAWSDPVIVTTQASGRDVWAKISSGDGKMRFAIEDKETYIYKFYTGAPETATTIEVDYQNKGAVNAGIAFVCKANEDHTSWFEARVSASDSNYYFYQYDKKRKEVEGKNPYVVLGKGHMKIDEFFPTKPNHIIFTCDPDQLSIDVNGKKKGSQSIDVQLDGTLFGVGVMSADVIPATIDFDTVTLK